MSVVAAVRQLADWLVVASTGVNAQLASVPKDPTDPTPAPVTVYDSTRFAWVARGTVPRDKTGSGPLLLVTGPEEAEVPIWAGAPNGAWGDIECLISYVQRPLVTVDTDFSLTDALQTLRAAARAIQAQFQTMQEGPERMGATLERPRVRLILSNEKLEGNEVIVAMLAVTFSVADPWVAGATVS